MTAVDVKHPAKFTPSVIAAIRTIAELEAERAGRPLRILDPFAAVGGIHVLADDGHDTVGVELEREWANTHDRTEQGDATRLRFDPATFDAVITSPCYANRMADLYDGRDGSKRMTYRIALGHDLHEGSAAGMQWGPAYRLLHTRAWSEAARVVRPGGLIVINVSNHIRRQVEQLVVEWHLRCLLDMGCQLVEARPVETPRYRHGQNHEARVDAEMLLVVRSPQRQQERLL